MSDPTHILIAKMIYNANLPFVDKTFYMQFNPGWYDIYTLRRLTQHTECATYCANVVDLLMIKQANQELSDRHIEN